MALPLVMDGQFTINNTEPLWSLKMFDLVLCVCGVDGHSTTRIHSQLLIIIILPIQSAPHVVYSKLFWTPHCCCKLLLDIDQCHTTNWIHFQWSTHKHTTKTIIQTKFRLMCFCIDNVGIGTDIKVRPAKPSCSGISTLYWSVLGSRLSSLPGIVRQQCGGSFLTSRWIFKIKSIHTF